MVVVVVVDRDTKREIWWVLWRQHWGEEYLMDAGLFESLRNQPSS